MKIAVNGKKIELKDKKLQRALDDQSNGDFSIQLNSYPIIGTTVVFYGEIVHNGLCNVPEHSWIVNEDDVEYMDVP